MEHSQLAEQCYLDHRKILGEWMLENPAPGSRRVRKGHSKSYRLLRYDVQAYHVLL